MGNGLKRAHANAKLTRILPGMGIWLEEYKCGCSFVTKTKSEALGYCPTHGEDRRHLYKLTEPVAVGLAR